MLATADRHASRLHLQSRYLSIQRETDVSDWARALGTTPDLLRDAVMRVGTSVVAVRQYLAKRPASRTGPT